MNKKFYVTTAIPYVNAAPHVGHSLEFVQADAIARFHRLLGDDVHFLSGTDDNALKNVQAAEEQKTPVIDFVTKNSNKFKSLLTRLGISIDDFIRTTELRHIKGAQALWLACRKEDVYRKKYKGAYCVGCETFYLEKDLVDGKCPEHKKVPEIVEEENYFFKLSNYQSWLEQIISTDELKIVPEIRKNEVLAFVRGGLEDFSISRSVARAHGWGIPVPGDKNQIIYVWFDALANYITALDWHDNSKLYQKYWPADCHVIGKGISRFHAIYWPAMLKSAGLPIPKEIFVHGYITAEGEKISKSLGNVIDPIELLEKFSVDAIRYYLLREIPSYGDGDFSYQRFYEIYNSELANNLGNLVSRVTKLADGLTVAPEKIEISDQVSKHFEKYAIDLVIKYIFETWINPCNLKLNEAKPWTLDQDDPNRRAVLIECVSNLKKAAYHLRPIVPDTAKRIEGIFSGVVKPLDKPLFPRVQNPSKSPFDPPQRAGKGDFNGGKIVVGKIEIIEKLSDETIQRVVVNIGDKSLNIICGDKFLQIGRLVAVALPGAEVCGPDDKRTKIKKSKIHGFESEAMLCSGLELGVNQDHSKIHILPGNLKVGEECK